MILKLYSAHCETALDVLKHYHLSKKFRKQIFASLEYQFTTECGQQLLPHTVVPRYSTLYLKIPFKTYYLKDHFNNFNIKTVYEDEFIVIVDKPAGLYSHKATFNPNHQLSIQEIALQSGKKIHILTRLDQDTSGLMILLKFGFIHGMMHKKEVIKRYEALIYGQYKGPKNIVLPIGRKVNSIIERTVSIKGLPSRTEVESFQYYHEVNMTKLRLRLHSGRTHQIRVHLQSLGHPIVGETLYANDHSMPLQLKCTNVSFVHPITLKRILINL